MVTLDAAGIDLVALRARVLRDELLWATDVYETTPVPLGDPILGRDNVMHTPGIDVLVDSIAHVLRSGEPRPWDCIAHARSAPIGRSGGGHRRARGHAGMDAEVRARQELR